MENLEPPKLVRAESIENVPIHPNLYSPFPIQIDRSSDGFRTPTNSRSSSMSTGSSPNSRNESLQLEERLYYLVRLLQGGQGGSKQVAKILHKVIDEHEDLIRRGNCFGNLAAHIALKAMKKHPKITVLTNAMMLLEVVFPFAEEEVPNIVKYALMAMRKVPNTFVQMAGAGLLYAVLERYGRHEEIFICFSAEGGVEHMILEFEKRRDESIRAVLMRVVQLVRIFRQEERASKRSNESRASESDNLLKLHVDLVQLRLQSLPNRI